MNIGDQIVIRQHGLILTALVEETNGELVRIRVESPRGEPCQFSEWWKVSDLTENGPD